MSKKRADNNLQFALFFLVLVGGIIFLSLIVRGFFLVKETKFDGSSHFTLQLNKQNKNEAQYISFSPRNQNIGILTFKNTTPPFEIPVDSRVNTTIGVDSKNIKTSLFKMIFDFKNQKEINFIDLFRLDLFSQTVKESSVEELQVDSNTDKSKIDAFVSTFFADPQIQDEKLSIEVINATEVSGLGNKVANLVSNAGANVVLVSTGDLRKESAVEYSESSYTVDKLSEILRFKKTKVSKRSLADVTLIIGRDYVR